MLYAKAIMAGIIAGLGTAATALADGHVTAAEGVGIALTTVIAIGGVFGVKNAVPVPPVPPVPPLVTPGQD